MKKIKKIIIISSMLVTLLSLPNCDYIFGYHGKYDLYKDAIYLIDKDGDNITNLIDIGHTIGTYDGGSPEDFSWTLTQFTQDGSKLIYSYFSWGLHINSLYSIDLNDNIKLLLTGELDVYLQVALPSISNLDSRIAFSVDINYEGGYYDRFQDIYIVNSDATGLANLTNTYKVDEMYPRFLPNGENIIFTSIDYTNVDTQYYIIQLNLNTAILDTIAHNNKYPYNNLAPSPDGSKIFFGKSFGKAYPFFVMDKDGTNEIQLYSNVDIGRYYTFSSDGSKIAFSDYNYLYVMNTDGSGITQIETSIVNPYFPIISHNGSQILFSGPSITDSIYIINNDGSDEMGLHEGFLPAFSSNEERIAFSGYYFYKTVYYSE